MGKLQCKQYTQDNIFTCVGFFLQFYLNVKNDSCNNKNDDHEPWAYQLGPHEDNALLLVP